MKSVNKWSTLNNLFRGLGFLCLLKSWRKFARDLVRLILDAKQDREVTRLPGMPCYIILK